MTDSGIFTKGNQSIVIERHFDSSSELKEVIILYISDLMRYHYTDSTAAVQTEGSVAD